MNTSRKWAWPHRSSRCSLMTSLLCVQERRSGEVGSLPITPQEEAGGINVRQAFYGAANRQSPAQEVENRFAVQRLPERFLRSLDIGGSC